jgi:hypothetical protein
MNEKLKSIRARRSAAAKKGWRTRKRMKEARERQRQMDVLEALKEMFPPASKR